MAHIVKCKICGIEFDRDKVDFVQISTRRYAHLECAENQEKNKTKEEKDYEELEAYIKKLFNENYVNARIRKQLKEYKEQYNYSYSGILKALKYWYEIKNNSIEKANGGIGIIPFIYQEAYNYYYNLFLVKLKNADKDFNVNNFIIPITINIKSPRAVIKKPQLWNLGE